MRTYHVFSTPAISAIGLHYAVREYRDGGNLREVALFYSEVDAGEYAKWMNEAEKTAPIAESV